MSFIIGIDPGASGAVAILEADGSLVQVFDMPAVEIVVGGKANRPALNGRTNKITRLWRCAACLQTNNETVNRSNPQHP